MLRVPRCAEEVGSAEEVEIDDEGGVLLQALRDRLTVDEAVEFAFQLPQLLRVIYYEGWTPARPR